MSDLGDIQNETGGEITDLVGSELVYVVKDDDTDHVITTSNLFQSSLNNRYVPLTTSNQDIIQDWSSGGSAGTGMIDVSTFLPNDDIRFVNLRAFLKNESDTEAEISLGISTFEGNYSKVLYGYDGGSSSGNIAYSINEFQAEISSSGQELYYDIDAPPDDTFEDGWIKIIGYWI